MKWIIKKETVSTEYLPLKRLNIMEGDNIVTRLTDKDENSKVNANLIASAPQMLELLKNILAEVRPEISRVNESAGQTIFNPVATETIDMAKELIAKAEGK